MGTESWVSKRPPWLSWLSRETSERDYGTCRVNSDNICCAWGLSEPGWLADKGVKLASERNKRYLERWACCWTGLKAVVHNWGWFGAPGGHLARSAWVNTSGVRSATGISWVEARTLLNLPMFSMAPHNKIIWTNMSMVLRLRNLGLRVCVISECLYGYTMPIFIYI